MDTIHPTRHDDDMTDMDRWIDGGPVPTLAAGDTVTVTCQNCGHLQDIVIPIDPVDPVTFIVNTVAAMSSGPCPSCHVHGGWTMDRIAGDRTPDDTVPTWIDDDDTDPVTNGGRLVHCHGYRLTVPSIGHGPSSPCPYCGCIYATDPVTVDDDDMATVSVDYSDGATGHVTVTATTADDIVAVVESMTGHRMNVIG